MKTRIKTTKYSVSAILLAASLLLSGCSSANGGNETDKSGGEQNSSRYLRIVDDEPNTADPQCTSYYYNIPLNVFDRLIEIKAGAVGATSYVPSLADSWEVSDDGLVYTFHLHKGVTFSNGSPLTAEDVEYTLIRALTYPDSNVGDIGEFISGGSELMEGKTDKLEGFKALSDYDFTITLSMPYAAFLAMLSIPGYSILDKETTEAAGSSFGKDPAVTVGTGPFTLKEWNTGDDIILEANKDCWSGAPGCDGIRIQLIKDPETKRLMFEKGEIDILDLENLGFDAEFFIHGDIYRDKLAFKNRVGLTYIALNESVEPLNDVRVRHALQLALDRKAILMNIYGGRGKVENGIYPHGLSGANNDLPGIPYDPQKAVSLLEEAGYSDGFDLEITVDSSSTFFCREIMELAAAMWAKIGVRATIKTLNEDDYMEYRKSGKCACYTRRFSVDYNDPDAIIYVFFGSEENSRSNSLCYNNADIIDRVSNVCCIINEEERIKEYQELEKIIVQQDCAWIPLFSNRHYFVVNDRVKNFRISWNGWSDTQYRDVVLE